MKRKIFLLLCMMCIIALVACATKHPNHTNKQEMNADWPLYTLEEMMSGKSDLVVLATVVSLKQREDELLAAQYAQLDIQEFFYGESESKSIVLYQTVNKVEKHASYLLFLHYQPEEDVYFVADGNSQTLVSRGLQPPLTGGELLEVKVSDIKGKYTIKQLHDIFSKNTKENSSTVMVNTDQADQTAEIVENDEDNGINEFNEYALYIGDDYYPVASSYVLETILENAKTEELPAEFPYPASKRYRGDNLNISTFIVDDERGRGEIIYNISTTKKAETPRGVGVGDSLADLQAAYSGDLKYEANWMPDKEGPNFNRVYIYYTPERNRTYIAFFLYEKEIVMIEIQDGTDYLPGEDISKKEVLGMTGVFKEASNMSGKGADYKYILTNGVGEEEVLINLYARNIYEVDIDDDGITELVVSLPGNMQSLRIYDVNDGKISYIDVNEELGSLWSDGMYASNLKPEYRNYISAGFQNDDGTQRTEVYKVVDNELIYIGPYSDDMLM